MRRRVALPLPVLMHFFPHLLLIVPDAATALRLQSGVFTALALAGARVVPYFLLHRRHQRDGKAHSIGTPNSTDAMHIILLLVGQCHVDDKGDTAHINATCSDIRADEEPFLAILRPGTITRVR